MSTTSEDNHLRVVKFVQELLLDTEDELTISAEAISRQIDLVLTMKPSWGNGLDREKITDELIRRFSVWIGKDTTLKNEEDHVHWLNTSRKTNWRYWPRYREWMEAKLSWKAVDALDRSTDTILGLIEDPLREDSWDRRGLVVGHVQSGKTGSYTGLICKAADAGYKIVIVLAGMHNNLRSQTQVRLDEGFLGFATSSNPGAISFTGVGLNGRDADIKPNCATNRSDNGDFNRKVAKHLAITPEQRFTRTTGYCDCLCGFVRASQALICIDRAACYSLWIESRKVEILLKLIATILCHFIGRTEITTTCLDQKITTKNWVP